MAKHTPGPWKALEPRFGYQVVRQDPKDWDGNGYQLICSVPQSDKGRHYGEMFRANARLIAAAPDLNTAAMEAWRALMWIKAYDSEDQILQRAIDGLETAIMKSGTYDFAAMRAKLEQDRPVIAGDGTSAPSREQS